MPRFQSQNPRPKHKVYDVGGETGYEQLVHRLVDILDDNDDPSTVVVMGHADDAHTQDSVGYLRKSIKELCGEEWSKKYLGRLAHIGKIKKHGFRLDGSDEEIDNDRPFSLSGEMWADELVRAMREPNGAYDDKGKDHATVMAERQDQFWLRPKTVVSLFQSEKYLGHFLDKLYKPVTFYSVTDIHQPGIAARPGYEDDPDPEDFAPLFHTPDEVLNVPPPKWLIGGFCEEFDKLMLGGLSGHGKTLILLSIFKALLAARDEDVKLWDFFPVPRADHKAVYLVPEEGLAKFARRLRMFKMERYVQEGRLLVRTLSKGAKVPLSDPRILRACEGAIVGLDTAIRFSSGDESSASDNQQGLAEDFFRLEAAGAKLVSGLHHSPKSFRNEMHMELENVLRGSGDIGAMLSTAYGVRQIGDRQGQTWLHVECIKPRDIDPPGPFQLEGKPHIDQDGDFVMVSEPGATGPLSQYLEEKKSGRPAQSAEKEVLEKVRQMWGMKMSSHEIASALGGKASQSTVARWIRQHKQAWEQGEIFEGDM